MGDNNMYWKSVVIKNETGLHARPASVFIKTALKYKSNITIEKDGKTVNAKSMIALLSLGVIKGSTVKITSVGEDEEDAVCALVDLIKANFGEK